LRRSRNFCRPRSVAAERGRRAGGASDSCLAVREVTLGEDSTRTGLEILLEAHRGYFAGEFNRDHNRPRTVMNRVSAWAVVVPFEPISNVTRSADVMASWICIAANDIDDLLLDSVHPIQRRMQRAVQNSSRLDLQCLRCTQLLRSLANSECEDLDWESAFAATPSLGVRLRPLRGLRRDSLRRSGSPA
jgi:hypothetical protein